MMAPGCRASPLRTPLVTSLASLLQVLHAMGDDAGAARVATELDAHARSLAQPFDLAWGLSWLAFYKLARGDFAEVQSAALEALGVCKEHGYPLYQLVATAWKPMRAGTLDSPTRLWRSRKVRCPRSRNSE